MACCFHSEGLQNQDHTCRADRWVDAAYVLELFSLETRTHLADLARRFEVTLNLVPPRNHANMLHVKINRTCNTFYSKTLNEYIRTPIIQAPPHPPMQPYLVGFYLYIGDTSIFVDIDVILTLLVQPSF